jgi:hypothetical protein
MEGGTER